MLDLNIITAFTDVVEHSMSKTLVVLDIDETMIRLQGGVGTKLWWDTVFAGHLDTTKSKVAAETATLEQWRVAACTTQADHTDEYGLQRLMNEARETGNKIIAITARSWDIHESTERQLEGLDIRLDDVTVPTTGINHAKGVFYVGDSSKADALMEICRYLRTNGTTIRRVLFIDDVESHVREVSEALDGSDLSGHCYLAQFP